MSIPAPATISDGSAGVNEQKRLLATKLREDVERFFNRWDTGGESLPTLMELRRATERWFQGGTRRREIFLNLINRSEDHKAGYPYELGRETVRLDVNVLTSKYFRRLFALELNNDFAERFREAREIVTTLAWLTPEDRSRSESYRRLQTLAEMFGREQ